MKFKRLLMFLLAIMMLLSLMPAAYAAEIGSESITTEPTVTVSNQLEQTEATEMEESAEPPTDEYNGELDPILMEAGFTSDQLQAGNVLLEPISTFAASTRSVKKTATLRNCNWMDFPCTDNSRQGFHYADEDGAAPWDYMNMIYCLENKKDFSYGSGHAGVGDLPIDGSGDSHGESVWYSFSADQRTAIALVMLYGAPTKLWDESWGINATDDWNLHNPNIGYRFATQAIIWEFVQGLREPTPPYKLNSTYWLDKSQGVCMSEDGTVDHFMYAYNSIINDLQLHNVIPSFAGDFAATAPEIQLAGTNTTVTDTNGVLGRFTFTGSGGVSYSKNGNNLTITANGAIPTDVQSAIATLPDAASSLYEVWYNQYDTSKQVCIKVAIPASDPVPAYFKLKASNGSLSLKKTTEDGKNLAGWQFSIYADQNCTQLISGPHTSDANGNISVPNLTAGQVWVKEIGHTNPDINKLYTCDSANPQAVTIVAGQAASVSFYNKLTLGVAKIVKTATNGGSVSGWHFTVKDSAGNLVGNYVTDATGVITLNLKPGTFSVTETDGEYAYWHNDPQPTKTVTVKANETATVTFTNQWIGKAKIVKTATNGGKVEGWEFTIYDANGEKVGTYVTDSTGSIVVDLQPGSYKIIESDKNDPYWYCDTEPKTITVKAGETAEVSFQNQWIGKTKIIKVLDNPEAGTVEGWTFTISRVTEGSDDMQAEYIATITTGADGTILYDLEPGRYLITEELEENSLWQCVSGGSQVITVKAGETAEVTFTNALRPGKISIQKVDIHGEPLSGAKFVLQWSEDGITWNPVFYSDSAAVVKGGCSNADVVDGTLISPDSGLISWDNLYPTLQYRILELEAPEGYMLLSGPAYEGELPVEDLTVTLRVVNTHSYTLPETGTKTMVLMPVSIILCLAFCAGALVCLRKRPQ